MQAPAPGPGRGRRASAPEFGKRHGAGSTRQAACGFGRDITTKMSAYDYRPFLPGPSASKIAGPTPRAHAQARLQSPRAGSLFGTWQKLFAEPFKGITPDGNV